MCFLFENEILNSTPLNRSDEEVNLMLSVPDCFIYRCFLCYHTMVIMEKKKGRSPPTTVCFLPFLTPWSSIRMKSTCKIMITVSVNECNPVFQKSYDDAMERLEPSRLPCTCGCSGSCIRYGSYRRHVKAEGTKFLLTIQRVLCQNCRRSHALLPASLVPYSQIPLEDHVSLIETFEEGDSPEVILDKNPEMDDRTPFRLIRMYLLFWRERLLSGQIRLRPPVHLTQQCLSLFGRQFMQIKNTPNLFFSLPT